MTKEKKLDDDNLRKISGGDSILNPKQKPGDGGTCQPNCPDPVEIDGPGSVPDLAP